MVDAEAETLVVEEEEDSLHTVVVGGTLRTVVEVVLMDTLVEDMHTLVEGRVLDGRVSLSKKETKI